MSLLKKDSESDPFKELKRILKQVSLKHCGQVERMECGHPLPPRWTGADKHTQASLLACCLFLYCLKAKGGITYFSIQNFKKKKRKLCRVEYLGWGFMHLTMLNIFCLVLHRKFYWSVGIHQSLLCVPYLNIS